VIVTNSNIAEQGFDFVASFSGPDNITQGARSAEIMCDKFKAMGIEDEARIVQISGQPGYTTAIERAKGFEDRLPEVCPNVTLVETQPGDWNREKSQRVMEAFLVKYDDIDGVYSGDDNMGVGALNAAKAAGRDGIIFVGATNFAVGYEAMERGEYWGSIYQSPVDDAEAALETAIDVLEGRGRAVPQLLRHAEDHPGQHGRVHQAGVLTPRPRRARAGGARRPGRSTSGRALQENGGA
jgi:ribose transport system substrate-binding protein